MQDNHMDKIWRDKLGGYQAPADPQDWADMAAMLDAQDAKRAGFFWWWLIAAALFVTVGGGLFHLMQLQNEQIDAFAISATNGSSNTSTTTASSENNGVDNTTDTDNRTTDGGVTGNENNNGNTGNDANSVPGTAGLSTATTGNTNGNDSNSGTASVGNNTSKNGKGNKNNKRNKKGNTTSQQNNSGLASTNGTLNGNGNANNPSNTNGSTSTNGQTNAGGGNGYDAPVGTISVKRLKQLPNQLSLNLAQSHDTTKYNLNDRLMKRRAVQHYLGLSTGWVHSRVDRSGDFRAGYNVGLQYTMMVKNRAGFHVGLAFRQYRYYTDLVACNYDIYQCPNSYSSTLQTIDLNVGAQVNLVKTDKVEWYVMGGVSNQFMMNEQFDYNLPAIDTSNPNPVPNIPPTNTSFTGAGASDFESSIDASFDANSLITTAGETATGKFLRERYLGAWYVGTGVTYNFANRMNLQVEPVIGRSFQFVGIQDKKLWQTGVNVRMNVRLGR